MTRLVLASAAFALMLGSAQAESNWDTLPDASILPASVIQVSPVVPGMGEHWADPADLPLGPIYCVYNGKVVCLEFMIAQEDFAKGESWPVLAGIDGLPPVNHLNVGFEPNGHEGYEIPHYDIHMYFLSPEEMAEVR